GQAAVNTALMRPRKRFTMTIGGVTLFDVFPGATPGGQVPAPTFNQMDITNGPTPRLEILGIIGTSALRVRFSVDFVVPNCDTVSPGLGYLNLRFWIADDIDCKTWTTTR